MPGYFLTVHSKWHTPIVCPNAVPTRPYSWEGALDYLIPDASALVFPPVALFVVTSALLFVLGGDSLVGAADMGFDWLAAVDDDATIVGGVAGLTIEGSLTLYFGLWWWCCLALQAPFCCKAVK